MPFWTKPLLLLVSTPGSVSRLQRSVNVAEVGSVAGNVTLAEGAAASLLSAAEVLPTLA
jgi:hypothetical protein